MGLGSLKTIEDDIDIKRQELENSFVENRMTVDCDILELSQKLDDAIMQYYVYEVENKNDIIIFI